MSLINNVSGEYSMSKTSFCEYVTCEMKRIIFYAAITTFQKEKCVRLSALSELWFAGGWPSFGHNMHGHGGTIDTGCVCVCGGGRGTGRSKVGTLSISASVFTVWGTNVSAGGGGGGGLTLFSEGLGTGHHRRALWLHCWGVGAPCERYGARGVISVWSEPKPGDILDTWGWGCFFVLFQNHKVKGGTEAPL